MSGYLKNLSNTTASNYTVQPGKGDYPKQAQPMDPEDHPAAGTPSATYPHWGTVIENGGSRKIRMNSNSSGGNE